MWSLPKRNERLVLSVGDDGVGAGDAASGYGVDGMHERASSAGGKLTVDAPGEGGTRVRFEAPL